MVMAHMRQFSENGMLSDRFDEAMMLASRLHRRQTRKGSSIPYMAHLMAVSALVLEHGGTEDQAIAGLLHDAVEDQGGIATHELIQARFGAAVATIVRDCSDSWGDPQPPWRLRKEAYIAALPRKPAASLLVSLADKTHNARAILGDHGRLGDALWGRFSGGRDGMIWYYRRLSEIYPVALPSPLAQEFAEIVAAFPTSSP